MKPPSFDYAAPATVADAVTLLERYDGEAMVLAGGQSLMPLLNMRFARPAALVDLNRVEGLGAIREEDGHLVVGAMVTKRQVERSELVAARQPLLHAATRWIAHPQIRNRGTVGGSMAQADPAAEYPAVAVALGAQLRVAGPDGERVVAAEDFFVTYLTTDLDASELLTEIRVPVLPERTGWSIQEVARRHGDFAMVGGVFTLALDGSGRCGAARVVLFGVGPVPLRATAAEAVLEGRAPDEALFAEAAAAVQQQIDEPIADVHASAEYRRHLAGVLTRRGLAEAAGRAS